MDKKRKQLEAQWFAGELECSEEEFSTLFDNDELILNMVFADRKPISQTLDRQWKHNKGVSEIANLNGKRFSSSVDELENSWGNDLNI